MAGVQLYEGLIKATEQIVAKFGRNVLAEERFVNILQDLYKDRDNPAVFRIIKTMINERMSSELESINKVNVSSIVAKLGMSLSQKYGYDKNLVEGILFSLAIGYGSISRSQYNALSALNNKPTKKQVLPPSQNNYQNKHNPSKNTTNPRKKIKIDGNIIKYSLILIWGMLGLTISPLLYLYIIAENQGICLIGSIGIAVLHIFTLVPVSTIGANPYKSNPKTYPSIAGAMYGLIICGITFWIVFPVLFGFEFVLDIWGLRIKDSFPWITTVIANLFCAGILNAGLEGIERISGIPTNNKNNTFFVNYQLFKSIPFKKGFIIVVSYFLLIGFIAIIAPTVSELIDKYKIYRINNYIDEVNIQKISLKREREKEQRNLSFAQFSLDESYAETVSKIGKGNEFEIENPSTYNESLLIHEDNYISIIDSIITLKTQWNNETITLELFFVKDILSALRYSPLQTKGDSIISIYTSKYGEPEYKLNKYKYTKDEYTRSLPVEEISYTIEGDYIKSSRSLDKDKLYPNSYYWTYKNSLIKIDYEKSVSSYYYDYCKSATITYFSRRLEPILKRKKEIEDAIQKEIDKKRNDSIKRVREAERRKQQEEERRIKEQKRQEELNHNRSIEQI